MRLYLKTLFKYKYNMDILPEIPKDQLVYFKKNVSDWLTYDEKISQLETEIRELKKKRNKELEPKITSFMRSYNISDLNTANGKLRCNERHTRTTVSKKSIKESLDRVLKSNDIVTDIMDEIYLNRDVITSYKLSKVKK